MGASFTATGEQILMTSLQDQLMGLDVATGQPFHIRPLDDQAATRYYGPVVGPHPSDCSSLKSSKLFAVTGGAGAVLVCDLRTKMPIRTLRMRGTACGNAVVFSYDKEVLYSADQEANIYEWDLGSGRCLQRIQDLYATRLSCLAL